MSVRTRSYARRHGTTRDRWTAGRDGIAHLHRAGDRLTACHVAPIDERWAWPAASTCPRCLEAQWIDVRPPIVREGVPSATNGDDDEPPAA